ncbi:MAG: hypothetical protein KF735_06795 [Chelatococcus sp.]|uniref:hypothetical protein n=1 Tax=Chelatococcus sp. TaxID=1953771 RepID=UPI0025BA5F33|nr:hypothetical protein [Chelatococcus sp.]MBX3537323.1 hypothetical protein [Chelatococcus sp.]
MDEVTFGAAKADLDADLDALPKDAMVGILLSDSFREGLLSRGLLKDTVVDMLLWKWEQETYRNKLVYVGEGMIDGQYRVGTPKSQAS